MSSKTVVVEFGRFLIREGDFSSVANEKEIRHGRADSQQRGFERNRQLVNDVRGVYLC